jgi:sarcosine oxidase subunit beta
MSQTADAVVIGGGVHGASVAYHLAKRGLRVALLEKKFLAAGGTGKSTAVVRMHYDNVPEAQLVYESAKYFFDWANVVGGDAGFVRTGFARIVLPSEVDALKANVAMQQRIGIRTQLITAQEFEEIEPAWDISDVEYAAYEPDSGYADPQATTLSFAKRAQEMGARILQETTALKIISSGSRVAGVLADRVGEIAAPIVVVVAGPWTPRLVKPLGIDLPIQCERHQVGSFVRPKAIAKTHLTCIDGAREMYFRPEGQTLTLAGCGVGRQVDPDNYNEKIDDEHTEFTARRISQRIPKMADGLSQGGWAGFYDMTPDEKCIVAALPVEGLYVNAGQSGTGFKTAPALGLCLSELICDGAAKTVDLHPFRWARFAEGQPLVGEHPYSTSWHTGRTA